MNAMWTASPPGMSPGLVIYPEVNRYQVEPGPTLLPQQSWALSAEADFSGVITLLGVLTLGLAGVWLLQRRKGR
jgi:hypothetical protein